MRDMIIYMNKTPVFRTWAKSKKDAMQLFVAKFGPWNKRPGYTVYVKEFDE